MRLCPHLQYMCCRWFASYSCVYWQCVIPLSLEQSVMGISSLQHFLLCASVLIFCAKCFTCTSEDINTCLRKREKIAVEWPDCDPAMITVPICTGTCKSFDVMHSPPFFSKQCSCCKSSVHSIRKREVTFTCNGEKQNHTVFYPKTTTCACVHCGVQ